MTMASGIESEDSRIRERTNGGERHPAPALSALLNASNEGYWLVDNTGAILEVNPRLCEILRAGRAELIGRSVYELTDAKGSEALRHCLARSEAAPENICDINFHRATGGTVACRLGGGPVFADAGEKSGSFALITDISELRHGERMRNLLGAAIEHIHEMLLITDASGVIQYANSAFYRLTGYTRNEVLGHKPSILKSGTQNPQFYATLWETLTRGNVWTGRIINRRRDGVLFEEDAVIYPIFGPEGEISHYVGVLSDITAEAGLDRAKEFFSTVTAHEMRTPLSKLAMVKMLLQSMAHDIADSRLNPIVTALEDTYDALERVETATSVIAGLGAGLIGGERSANFLPNVVHHAVEKARLEMRAEARTVKIVIDDSVLLGETQVNCNFRLLAMALKEILSNAVKYTPNGKTVTITQRVTSGRVALTVRDEGAGIAPQAAKMLFIPFFSPENILRHSSGIFKYDGGGMGLGLTVASAIMSFHQGDIALQSDGPGKGTTATLTLPLA